MPVTPVFSFSESLEQNRLLHKNQPIAEKPNGQLFWEAMNDTWGWTLTTWSSLPESIKLKYEVGFNRLVAAAVEKKKALENG